MITHKPTLGIGWRPELAWFIENRHDLGFIELVAENCLDWNVPPPEINRLIDRGVKVILHATTLSLGGAEKISADRLKKLANCARMLGCDMVSEHICFVRAGGVDSGHLLPVERTKLMLDLLCDNIARAQEFLPVPLVLENIASLFEFPDNEMSEPKFIASLLQRTNTRLLLDVANLYANSINHKYAAVDYLDALPLDRVEYMHIAGGAFVDGFYHDTHCQPISSPVLLLLQEAVARVAHARVMLERDGQFPPSEKLHSELNAIAETCGRLTNSEAASGHGR